MITAKKIKQHPILFSTPMVKAILNGKKSMTRRKCRKQPSKTAEFCRYDIVGRALFTDGTLIPCPFGKRGDILWGRETWRKYCHVDEYGYTKFDQVITEYRADNPGEIREVDADGWHVENKDGSEKFIPWRPSIFMPKELCRIWLEITDIRIERLSDITWQDIEKEGIEVEKPETLMSRTHAELWEELWININGQESWNENPWLWVIEFKRIENPNLN